MIFYTDIAIILSNGVIGFILLKQKYISDRRLFNCNDYMKNISDWLCDNYNVKDEINNGEVISIQKKLD